MVKYTKENDMKSKLTTKQLKSIKEDLKDMEAVLPQIQKLISDGKDKIKLSEPLFWYGALVSVLSTIRPHLTEDIFFDMLETVANEQNNICKELTNEGGNIEKH